jgi:hypothetical protein
MFCRNCNEKRKCVAAKKRGDHPRFFSSLILPGRLWSSYADAPSPIGFKLNSCETGIRTPIRNTTPMEKIIPNQNSTFSRRESHHYA